jgi:hypothetical protein
MVTFSPAWAGMPFQALVIFWSPGKVKVRVQPLMAVVPVLARVMLAVNPPCHWSGV